MTEFISFFVVIAAALVFPALFGRLHLPWVAALLIAGAVTGPHGLALFESNQALDFFGAIGLVFLMFMAGLEIELSHLKKHAVDFFVISVLGMVIPFVAGVTFMLFAGYSVFVAILIGTVMLTTSVAVIVPMINAEAVQKTRLGEFILGSAIISDIVSLAMLTILLRTATPAALPLPVFIILVLLFFMAMHWLMPRIRWLATSAKIGKQLFQTQLRLVIVTMVGIVLVFELLGLHAVIAGFLAGILLAHLVQSEHLHGKLRTISYGVFIPIFFVVVGSQVNWQAIFSDQGYFMTTLLLIVVTISAKFLSGLLAGAWRGLSVKASAMLGAASVPQLTVPLAVAFTGQATGILNEQVASMLIALVVTTTLVGPLLFSLIAKRVRFGDELEKG